MDYYPMAIKTTRTTATTTTTDLIVATLAP
jgi:hypothetical protein